MLSVVNDDIMFDVELSSGADVVVDMMLGVSVASGGDSVDMSEVVSLSTSTAMTKSKTISE